MNLVNRHRIWQLVADGALGFHETVARASAETAPKNVPRAAPTPAATAWRWDT